MPNIKTIFIIVIIIVRLRAQKLQSSLDIEQLIKTHEYVTKYLQKGIEHPILDKYERVYTKEHRKMELAEDFVGNPINVILLVKRLSIDLQLVEKYMPWIRTESDGVIFPDAEDFFNTAVSFWRLQVVYDLKVPHLADGQLYGHFSHDAKPYFDQALTMLISDCMELAYHSYYHKEYNISVSWALEGLMKYYDKQPDEIFQEVDESDIVHFIMLCYMKIGDYKEATEWSRKYMLLRPELMQDLLHQDPLDDFLSENNNKEVSDEKVVDIHFDNADRLCRGEVQLAHEKRKSLHCYLKFGPNSFLRLAPFKAEQLLEEPQIIIFYDVVSEAKFNAIKDGVMDKLRPSNVSVEVNSDTTDHKSRNSLGAHIHPLDRTLSPATRSVAGDMLQLAGDVTCFNMDSAEDLQVIRYGVGEYYKLHHDFYHEPHPVFGHRIATATFYLSDVEQGGATVFVGAPLTVYPVKGAMLLWYNLKPSGEKDYRTVHGSCPVLRGTKWVITLWMHELFQEFIRPCSLEQQET